MTMNNIVADLAASMGKPCPDARLLELLAETRAAHAAIVRAYDEAADEPPEAVLAPLHARLNAAREEMAATPAQGVLGALAKAARIADNLSDNGGSEEPGHVLDYQDAPVGASLGADLARLLPGLIAGDVPG